MFNYYKIQDIVNKVSCLGGTTEKQKVRIDIITQFCELSGQLLLPSDMRAMTLPGLGFVFEKELTQLFEQRFPGVALIFDCFENDRDCYELGATCVPANCNYYHQDITIPRRSRPYNLVWADFCGIPHHMWISDVFDSIDFDSMPRLVYFTFSCSSPVRTSYRARAIGCEANGRHSADVTKHQISEILNELGLSYKCVYDVVYLGGAKCKSTMMTVGYMLSYKQAVLEVTPIVERRCGAKYCAAQKLVV